MISLIIMYLSIKSSSSKDSRGSKGTRILVNLIHC